MNTASVNLFRSWKMLVAELLVIFLGVYAAFWVENYRDQRDREDRTEQLKQVLVQDLDDYIEVSTVFCEHIDSGLLEWDEARARAETPPPFVFRIYGAEKPPLTTWHAVSQSQAAELLDAGLLYELGFFYNEIEGMGLRYVRYATVTESVVLPGLKRERPVFYTDDNRTLLPEFAAHMDRLREYTTFTRESVDWAACLRDRLASAEDAGTTCRRAIGVSPL